MPQLEGSAPIISRDSTRQRLHGDFENALWYKENEKRPDDMKVWGQEAGYFAIASRRFEMLLGFCEG